MTNKQLLELLQNCIENYNDDELFENPDHETGIEIDEKELCRMIFENSKSSSYKRSFLSLDNKEGNEAYYVEIELGDHEWINISDILDLTFCEHCEEWKTEKFWTKRAGNGNIVLCDECEAEADED